MDPITIIEGAKKHGISVLVIFACFWLNNRLTISEEKIGRLEDKLYDCLEDKSNIAINHPLTKKHYDYNEQLVAVLPDRIKICLS